MKSSPRVLHLGDNIKYNKDFFESEFKSKFEIVQNEDLDRESFINALKSQKYGDFVALFRPFWNTGGEMGQWDRELISLLPKSCKLFASAGAGFNWADVDVFAEYGIMYCNSVTCSDESVADIMIWHLISMFRNVTWGVKAARSGDPETFTFAHQNIPKDSRNPSQFSFGIIGFGSIGQVACRKIKGCFGMRLHYYDIMRADPAVEKELELTFHSDLESLLKEVDVVSICCPYNSATHHLMNKERFSQMKNGAKLINVARGPIVEEAALVEALKNGKLSAAGLDVFENEPVISKELLGMENVTLTPHIAGGTVDTWINFELLAMKNIKSYIETGKTVTRPVNFKLLQNK